MAASTVKRMGRPSIFRGKVAKFRVQGLLTVDGKAAFERRRQELARLTGLDPERVSDADTILYLSFGKTEAIKRFES